jgi:hypothetical protein
LDAGEPKRQGRQAFFELKSGLERISRACPCRSVEEIGDGVQFGRQKERGATLIKGNEHPDPSQRYNTTKFDTVQ